MKCIIIMIIFRNRPLEYKCVQKHLSCDVNRRLTRMFLCLHPQPGRKGKVPLEVGLLKRVCAVPACPSIIQMHEYILRRKYIFIFMELLESSMSLEDYIYKNIGPMNEEKAKHAFRQIVQAVLHCHSRGVFHNDIKPNNIMYQTTTGQIKLIDFGYGDLLHEEKYKYAPGTLEYWPPEWCLFKKYKAEPVTVWTLGVTLFELLCGKMPFKGKLEIMECKIFITREVSVDCKDMIEKCLCFRPRDRPTLKDILNHPWLLLVTNTDTNNENKQMCTSRT
uniref:Serine/threonine-protein kinase 1 n=1 Tax=Erpetoichthys calabaricus TaxID=27687 RepID=A0A8C4RE24_ERPCA